MNAMKDIIIIFLCSPVCDKWYGGGESQVLSWGIFVTATYMTAILFPVHCFLYINDKLHFYWYQLRRIVFLPRLAQDVWGMQFSGM
jgi:hypothetical protein